ncbi:hypothetical protein AYI68_g3585 [Smittium mucronatum]|uniref:Uncharacterized protein n=1 Tax=Smittium mucronatum TaxID=133383 RepID=A0A1R0GZK1_9FUNG|nr:hypothetical protein AYI68_g3585 [Smittium mucronatum]
MNFIENPKHFVESYVKPLIDSEKFDAQLAANNTSKRPKFRKPFRGRQQFEGRSSLIGTNPATALITETAAPRSGSPSRVQESLDQAHGQPEGRKNRNEGFPDQFQGSGTENNGL